MDGQSSFQFYAVFLYSQCLSCEKLFISNNEDTSVQSPFECTLCKLLCTQFFPHIFNLKKYYFILWALREIARNNLHSKQAHIMHSHFKLSYKIYWVIQNIIVIIDLLFKVWTHFSWNC